MNIAYSRQTRQDNISLQLHLFASAEYYRLRISSKSRCSKVSQSFSVAQSSQTLSFLSWAVYYMVLILVYMHFISYTENITNFAEFIWFGSRSNLVKIPFRHCSIISYQSAKLPTMFGCPNGQLTVNEEPCQQDQQHLFLLFIFIYSYSYKNLKQEVTPASQLHQPTK